MKKTLSIVVLLLFSFLANAQNLVVTNGDMELTISNGVVIKNVQIALTTPILLTTNGVVVPQAFLDEIAVQTGIPIGILNMIPLKYMVWISIIFFILVSTKNIAVFLRKVIPDNLQVGNFGLILSHLAGEINPSIPKLAAAATQQDAIKMADASPTQPTATPKP